jgi:4a-hydroxytetrahydrobiopterin dehydratase
MGSLAQGHCVACEAGMPPLSEEQARELLPQVPGWQLEGNTLTRRFKFKDFQGSMAFVNRVAELAESEGHHPDIHISWNRVRLELTTHSIKGLSENDFIMAARINEVFE